MQHRPSVKLSAHCSDYCHALCNPTHAKPCGLPTTPSLPTLKSKCYAKGTAYTGTAGFGFIALDPRNSVVNDAEAVLYSDASFAGGVINVSAVAGVNAASTNATYASSDIGSAAANTSYRIVGSSLAVRYGGTELNRGGFKVGLVDPTHSSVLQRNEATMNAELQARKVKVTRDWTTLTYRPVNSDELNFSSTISAAAPYMAFCIISPDNAIAELFEWEVYTIVEYQGRNVRGQTHTNPDPIGFAAVSAVANQTNGIITKPAAQAAKEMHSAVATYVDKGISAAQTVTSVAQTAASTVSTVAKAASTGWSIFEDILDIAAP